MILDLLPQLHDEFLLAAVVNMYRFEATQVLSEPLLSDAEILDCHHSYCGGPL